MALAPLLVVGIGHPDRGDDAVGAAVIEAMLEALGGGVPPGVELARRHGDMLGLLDAADGRELLVCVDASAPEGAPGRVRRIDASREPLPREPQPASSHGIGLAEALALAQALGRLPQRVVIYAIEGAAFAPGAALAPAVAAAVPEVAARVLAELSLSYG